MRLRPVAALILSLASGCGGWGDAPAHAPADAAAEAAAADATSPADAGPEAGTAADAAPLADGAVAGPCVHVAAPTACPAPPVRYRDVRPIIRARCLACHYGYAGGPWPLTTYEHVADWADNIRADLLDCTMPPTGASQDMTAEEKTAILTWIRCGVPD
jgi:uncharacterized membrane protein